MKKISLILCSLVTLLFLGACHNQSSDGEKMIPVAVTIEGNGKSRTQEFQVEEGDSVMDVMEDNYDIEEDGGFITAIDGVSEDASKNLYWLYDINGKMAEVGAEEAVLKEGDKIAFRLEAFK
ncbi:DUF4430 domain-containing protein [Streptococcus sp. X16XC17]|uniref:DUF4430 domain-containing protein n=1 Tax=unclassified Streptococcus TaxID=2608887 RepID=UPI00066FF308|nr:MULTISPECIES: DUF4430 domain-containing protein [unclassified Streptococcus]TCD46709.1 DUF4430 domain-containing protein [Streptococcus sp. X16XC17]